MFSLKNALLIFAALLFCGCARVGSTHPGKGSEPWSQRISSTILARHPEHVTIERGAASWSYSTSFLVYAVAKAQGEGPKSAGGEYARRYVARFVNDEGTITTPTYEPEKFKLDDVAPGRVLLWLYRQDAKPGYLIAARTLANQLKDQPRTADGGFWHKQIYPHQMWLDGIYMACPFMAELGQITDDPAWFDEACHQILTIAKHTRDPKTGLYYHGWDESRQMYWADPRTGLSRHFWGRAMGWYMMGIVDTLEYLPADHPRRAEVVGVLRQAATAVASVQDQRTGLWYQVLDQGKREGNYLESSASCMIVYALAKGSRLGCLDAQFAKIAKTGYAGILKRFVEYNSATGQVSLHDTCQVAGLGGAKRRDGSYEYYLSEPRVADDPKGLAPFILASLEMESKE